MLYVVMHIFYDNENYTTGYEPIGCSYSKDSAEQFMAQAIADKQEHSSFEIVTVPLV